MYEGKLLNIDSHSTLARYAYEARVWAHWTLVIVGLAASVAFVRVNLFEQDFVIRDVEMPRITSKK